MYFIKVSRESKGSFNASYFFLNSEHSDLYPVPNFSIPSWLFVHDPMDKKIFNVELNLDHEERSLPLCFLHF
jgi:hypothetical protein